MSVKKIVVAAGGTGGHLFPAQALAAEMGDAQILFLGHGLAKSPYFCRSTYNYVDVAAGPLPLRRPVRALVNAMRLVWGTFQSYRAIKKFKPDLVVGFGSYHTLPSLTAARLASVPIILHEANSVPGKVNRLFSKGAAVTGISFPAAKDRLVGKVADVALPLRSGYLPGTMSAAEARKSFGLDPERETLLIFGGSQGARRLNEICSKALAQLHAAGSDVQVIHLTGSEEVAAVVGQRYAKACVDAYVAPFEHQMERAWAAATMAITRSGASSLAEQIAMEVPGIVVPYPYAADGHQEGNADHFVDVVGGGVKLSDREVTVACLARTLFFMLSGQHYSMRKAIQHYKTSNRQELSDLVSQFLEKHRL